MEAVAKVPVMTQNQLEKNLSFIRKFAEILGEMGLERLREKEAEEVLRESENKFRGLVENSIVGVYLSQNDIFKYVNSRFAEIHGYEIEEIVDKQEAKETMTFPEDLPLVEENVRKRMTGKDKTIPYEFRIITKSQEIKNVEVFGVRTMYREDLQP